jgi:predicted RecB family nuclease
MTRITSRLLEAYLKCPTKCWLTSVGEQSAAGTFARCAQAQNESYRAAEIRQLLSRTPQSECMISPSPESLKVGKWHLATGLLARTLHLESYLHAVECLPPERRGKPATMIVIRFVTTNKLNSEAKLMLAFDALALSEMLGQEVSFGKIIHGDNHATLKVRTSAIMPKVRKHTAKIAELLSSSSPPDLVLIPHCAECEFQIQCRQKAIEKDDLSLLSGMTVKERKKLHDKGIFTVTQLSYTFRPRRRPKKLRDKREKYYHSLRALAIRQKKIHIIGSPEMTIEGTPVYFDVEGLPDRDFYYLIGVRIGNPDSPVQHSLWADNAEDEMKIWNEFIGILSNVKDPILIHYGSYETVFLKRMGVRYGVPTAESKVRRAIQTSKNVLSVIFAQVYFPTFSNRLKDIGHFLGMRWNNPVLSGFQSLACRLEWEQSRAPELKAALVAYNRDDCVAIESVTSHLTNIIRDAKSRADVEFSDKPKQIASKKGVEIHGSLKSFLKSAHFEYAHSRIKLLAKKPTQAMSPNKKQVKSHPLRPALSMMKGRIVRVPRRRVCPKHAGHNLRASSKVSQHSLIDLIFSKTGCRKTVVRYTGLMGNCDLCKLSYPPPGVSSLRNQHFGWKFQSWVVYQRIALRMSYRLISKAAFDLFSEQLSPTTAQAFVEKFAGEYQHTEDLLLHNILDGPVVHLDETKINILGADQYVWVLTDNARVVFRLRPSREAAFLHPLLSSFKGSPLPISTEDTMHYLVRSRNASSI